MEEVEQFVIFMAAYELYTFIDEHETCPIASQFKVLIATILDLCIIEFNENIYVVDTRKKAAQERSNVLQEEDDENISLEEEVCEEEDKNLSLGMPVQPQEDDENGEQLENEERKLQPSPPMDEGNTQDFADDKLCFYNSMMRKNINLCLMRTLLIMMMRSMV